MQASAPVTYVAKRATEDGGVSVHVLLGCGHTRGLDPRFDLRRHSPTGFQMGYAGSGPAQLALALLADALGNDDLAQDLYQTFKSKVVAAVPREEEEWRITREQIREWAEQILSDRTRDRGLPPSDALDRWADRLEE
jgi:hypothetical protein